MYESIIDTNGLGFGAISFWERATSAAQDAEIPAKNSIKYELNNPIFTGIDKYRSSSLRILSRVVPTN